MYYTEEMLRFNNILSEKSMIDIKKGWHSLFLYFLEDTKNLDYKIVHVKNNNNKIKIVYFTECRETSDIIKKIVPEIEKVSSRICEKCGKIHDEDDFICC